MRVPKRWPIVPLAATATIAGQILYAAHRPDLPSYDNYETSGPVGDPGLPGLRLVAIGDSSITAPGVDHVDDAWIRRVTHSLTDRYFVHLHALAVGGSKAADVLRNQLPRALELEPDLAIVSVAANDSIRGVPPGRFREEVNVIVGTLAATGTRVVVVGVGDIGSIPRLPRFLRWYLTRRSAQFDRLSAEVAAGYPNAVKVDVRGDLSAAFWNDPSMFSGDRFHASSYGHEHFAHHVSIAVEAALALRPMLGASDP
jgi:lysophospholipase L1-like esterase